MTRRLGRSLRALALLACALVGNAGAVPGEPTPDGARDPFALPARLRGASGPAAVARRAGGASTGNASVRAGDGGAAPASAWNPGLRALLVDGANSMVNVGGVLLSLGKCVDGFCLVEVREGEARFIRQGRTIVLRLPQEQETSPR